MKKLFTNDVFFAIVTWFAVIATFPIAISVFLYYDDPTLYVCQFGRVFTAICLAVMYVAYQKHSKNVMKGMIGAVLATLVMLVAAAFFVYFSKGEYIISSAIVLAMVVLLFINHFIINSDHHSKPGFILCNQILTLVFAVLVCIESISIIPECVNTFDTIAQILTCFAQPFCVFSIVCVESRLDAYRKEREAAGWTEALGYPKHFIHAFQRKKKK